MFAAARKYIIPVLAAVIIVGNIIYIKFVEKNGRGIEENIERFFLQGNERLPDTKNNFVEDERKILIMRNGYRRERNTEIIDDGDYKCLLQHGGAADEKGDLIVFHDIDIRSLKEVPKKAPNEIWAFYGKEPQYKVGSLKKMRRWDGMFNYSATFLRSNEGNSHIFRAQLMKISPPSTHVFKPSPKMRELRVLWFVSHCTAQNNKDFILSARELYVLELSRYIHIDVYTKPNAHKCRQILGNLIKNGGQPDMNNYMFYLSFENGLCKDYISEKLWKVLESNSTTIPVALGGLSIEDYEAVAPPNSFIHVRNFTSPEALANHLKFVAQNYNAFHYYNQWRNEYWLKTRHVYHEEEGTYYCDFFEYFCRLIYEKPNRVWNTFSSDFSLQQCIDVSDRSVYCSYYNFTCAHDK